MKVCFVVLSGGSKDYSGSVDSLLVGFSLIFFFRNPKIFFENQIFSRDTFQGFHAM